MRISTRFAQRSARQSFLDAFVVLLIFAVALAVSCPAAADAPPTVPTNPRPLNGSTSQSIVSTLRWECIDFDNDMAAYDVYLGVDSSPPLAAANLTYKYYQPATLEPLTTYFWRVVARDFAGHETSSPTWSFTTGPENVPPDAPSAPQPADAGAGLSTQTDLAWSGSDVDGDSLTFSVYFGTDPSPPLVISGLAQASFSLDPLVLGTTYYWRVVALDARGAETSGPVWSFATRAHDQPPVEPFGPTPYSGYSSADLGTHRVSWRSSDPEGDALVYDVYFGTDPSPPLVASDFPHEYPGDGTNYQTGYLVGSTTYYWKIVAKDALGAETTGPVWVFTTQANSPPYPPSGPTPPDGSTGQSVSVALHWFAGDPDFGQQITYDLYLGTQNPPPLVSGPYQPLQFNTQYWWKVVARDPFGLESVGPVWTFTTGAFQNHPPSVGWRPTPFDNGQAFPITSLSWWSTDPDDQPTVDDVYFGTTEPLPLIATDVAGFFRTFALTDTLEVGSRYYWRIVSSDGELESTGPTWSFTVVNVGATGDVDNNGQETMADVDCAMSMFFLPSCRYDPQGCCGGIDSWVRADVNCDDQVTPRDARCIHKHMLNGACAYCEGTATAPPARRLAPSVITDAVWMEYDTLFVRLAVKNVPALESFGLYIYVDPYYNDPPSRLMRVKNLGGAEGFYTKVYGTSPSVTVGGYFFDAVDASSPVTLIEAVFFAKTVNSVHVTSFVDDLSGAPDLVIYGNEVPVLFSSFNAAPVTGGVQINWELRSDEAMKAFTLYRHDGVGSDPRLIVTAPVQSTRGSYLDGSAQPGRTYQYELAVETADGDVFRSPLATAATAPLRLALHQNYPNPFNPRTTIRYDIPDQGAAVRVRLWILDVTGRIVRTLVNEDQKTGSREAVWNGSDNRGQAVSSGVYFYVLDAGGERRTRKLVLLK